MSEPVLSRRSTLIILFTAVLAVLVFLFVYIEVNASRDDLLASKRAEAVTLIESFAHSSEASLEANTQLEDLIIAHLRSAAQFLRHRERSGDISSEYLAHVARNFDIDLFAIVQNHPRNITSSIPLTAFDDETNEAVDSISAGVYRWIVLPAFIGYQNGNDGEHHYALALERASGNGVVIAGLHESKLLEYRRRTGIGRVLQDLGNSDEIRYAVIQDMDGILTASKGVSSISSIEGDPFLEDAYRTGKSRTRIREFENVMTLEAVRRISVQDDISYLARIGLSLDGVQEIQKRSMRRVIMIGIALVALGALALGFLFTRRRFMTLQREHRRVKISTDLIMDNVADGIIATEADGTVTFSNAQARTLFGDGVASALLPSDPVFLHATRTSGEAIPYRESSIHCDGNERILGVGTSIIHNAEGQIESVIAIFRDLTDEKRAEEQLQRRERLTALGELAGGVAHEIRNPLNAISIIAQRLKAEFEPREDTEEYRQLTTTVRGEVERVNTIIKQFLDFARPPKLAMERMELHAIVAETADIISSQAKASGVHIEQEYQQHISISADGNALKQALLNLFQNALDAMPDGGTLTLQVQQDNERAMVRIADTGIGIPKEVQSKMFNLYFSTKSTGTGLGLSIVHQIISEHGGNISVSSTPGSGSVFTILFPLAVS